MVSEEIPVRVGDFIPESEEVFLPDRGEQCKKLFFSMSRHIGSVGFEGVSPGQCFNITYMPPSFEEGGSRLFA